MPEMLLKEKRWNKELETVLLKKWAKDKKLYAPDTSKPMFTIDTPPPYPSGRPWHIGAAGHYSQIDMIARTARMLGKNVYFPLGIDRNGLPVEIYTEKKNNIRLHEMPREKFVELCRTSLDDLEAEMMQIMRDMGMSCDFENYYRTDSEEYRALTQATFMELWDKGIIYEDTRPNNFCLDCGTTIADAEIVYRDLPTELVHIKFRVPALKKDMVIATTRPELICACQVVMVNHKDGRYTKFTGNDIEVPLFNRTVKLIGHPYPDPEFGSGIVMVCSYGDQSDVQLFRELQLQEIVAIDLQGRMTKAAGPYKGMKVKEARKRITEDLEKAGLVVKREKINHRHPTCERSKTPLEIIPMKEFYLRQTDVKDKVWDISKKIKFHPERNRQILGNWTNSITMDWPISRRRYYATEIPIWYCKGCGKACVPEPGPYYQPWKQDPPFKKCPSCGNPDFTGETRTLDTWMDSSITPLFISRYRKDDKFFRNSFPAGIRPQGKDIVRTWLYYTLLRCYQLTGKRAFEHAWISGYCVDDKGKKMSKSEGNVLDPIPILEKYGGDSFRFWSASESGLGSDFRASEDRVDVASKFLTKLWNVCRFISSFPQAKSKPRLTVLDTWLMGELDILTEKCLGGYRDFNFFIPSNAVREFIWNIFAPHYMELAKPRAYNSTGTCEEQEAARYTLHHCLERVLVLIAPVLPFITDHVYRELYGKMGVHLKKFPEPGKPGKLPFTTEELVELNSTIWKAKKDSGLSLKTGIKSLTVPQKFKEIDADLKSAHNAAEINYGKETKVRL